jgi:hypothetical protein
MQWVMEEDSKYQMGIFDVLSPIFVPCVPWEVTGASCKTTDEPAALGFCLSFQRSLIPIVSVDVNRVGVGSIIGESIFRGRDGGGPLIKGGRLVVTLAIARAGRFASAVLLFFFEAGLTDLLLSDPSSRPFVLAVSHACPDIDIGLVRK